MWDGKRPVLDKTTKRSAWYAGNTKYVYIVFLKSTTPVSRHLITLGWFTCEKTCFWFSASSIFAYYFLYNFTSTFWKFFPYSEESAGIYCVSSGSSRPNSLLCSFLNSRSSFMSRRHEKLSKLRPFEPGCRFLTRGILGRTWDELKLFCELLLVYCGD